MAESEALQARLRFLEKSSHVLAAHAPTAAATLGTARDELLNDQDADLEMSSKEWRAHRREVCGACGALMIPGWSCEVSNELQSQPPVKGKRRRRRRSSTDRHAKDMVFRCLRCDRRTSLALEVRPPKHMKKKAPQGWKAAALAQSRDTGVDGNRVEPVPKSASSSSKQRAKARKGGLQAMLAQSKAQTAGKSQGLDLMDFMQ